MYIQEDLFVASSQDVGEEIKKSSLNPRQWALYRLIKHNSLVEHRKTSQREIYEKLSGYGYEWNDDEKCHDHCVAIWNDITENNLSLEHEHLIISKNFSYWVGSEEENQKFLQDLWKAISPRLVRYHKYAQKIAMNGQGKLLDKNNNPINDESALNRFFSAFNDYDITMQQEVCYGKSEITSN